MYKPRDLLIPHTAAQSQLSCLLRDKLVGQGCNVVEVNRKFFNENQGVTVVQTLASSPLALDRVEAKYLGASRARASLLCLL